MKDEYYKILLFAFLYFIIFLVVFFVLPTNVLSIVFPIVGILFAWYSYQNGQKRVAYIYLVLTFLMVVMSVASIRSLEIHQGLIIGDIITIAQWAGFAIAAGYYIRFWPIFLLIAILMFVGFLYAVLSHQGTIWSVTRWIGYGLIILLILYNLYAALFPTEPYEQLIQVVAGFSMPFEVYYSIEIGTWIMAGFTFMSSFLGSVVSSSTGAGQ